MSTPTVSGRDDVVFSAADESGVGSGIAIEEDNVNDDDCTTEDSAKDDDDDETIGFFHPDTGGFLPLATRPCAAA